MSPSADHDAAERPALLVGAVLLAVVSVLGALLAAAHGWPGIVSGFPFARTFHVHGSVGWAVLTVITVLVSGAGRDRPEQRSTTERVALGVGLLLFVLALITAMSARTPASPAAFLLGQLRLVVYGLIVGLVRRQSPSLAAVSAGPVVVLLTAVSLLVEQEHWIHGGTSLGRALPVLRCLESLAWAVMLLRWSGGARVAGSLAGPFLATAGGWALVGCGLQLLAASRPADPVVQGALHALARGLVAAVGVLGTIVWLLGRDALRATRGAPSSSVETWARWAWSLGLLGVCAGLVGTGAVRDGAVGLLGWSFATGQEAARSWRVAAGLCSVVLAVGGVLLALGWWRATRAASIRTGTSSRPVAGTALGLVAAAALVVLPHGVTPQALPESVLAALPAGRSSDEALGREVFVREGCWHCHVLPQRGSARGPDLLRAGGARSAGWLALRLHEPGWSLAHAVMPRYRHLLAPDDRGHPVPTPDGQHLIAYLLRLQQLPARWGHWDAGLPAETVEGLGPDDAFRTYCSRCHGTEGRGDGPAATMLRGESLPRDLRRGQFRVRSHPERPTADDVLRSLRHGLPGSAMPGFGHLPEDVLAGLVEYVFELAGWQAADVAAVVIPPDPGPGAGAGSRGAELVGSLGCVLCHGLDLDGRGVAPSIVGAWVDEAGRPLPRSPDLVSDPLKGGDAPSDLYRTLFIGQGGSPMPSYAGALPSEADRWALVHHLRSLRASVVR